jgi:hypothetical protein
MQGNEFEWTRGEHLLGNIGLLYEYRVVMECRANPSRSGANPSLVSTDSLAQGLLRRDGFRVGDVSVSFSGFRHDDAFLGTALEPYRTLSSDCDIDVWVKWKPDLSQTAGRQLFDSGSTWRLYEDEAGFRFDFHAPPLGPKPYKRLLVDGRFSAATVQMSEQSLSLANHLPPMEYPLDELLIMHRLTQERAIELHGTGIVRNNGVANLFIGHSGAGKSTTTRIWTSCEEVEVLSDDRIIVRYDDGRDGAAGPTQMRMYGTPWHGEAMFASPNSAPLTRIFVLEHGHGNIITRLSRSEAVGELFARAFVPFHRHEYIDNALSFLEQLVSSVPCYRYSFEPTEEAVEKIQQFND